MEKTLLATRVQIPPLSNARLHRPRLIDALEDGISRYKLTHISAPAGYGKTTLLTQWASTTNYDIAWLSLSDDIHDLVNFLRYVLRAWERSWSDVKDTSFGLLLNSSSVDIDQVLTSFINVADTISNDIVFVLDDYHLIDSVSIHEALSFLIDNLPATVHFIVSERGESPLPIARYRAKNIVHEFRADDLKFRVDETSDYLQDLMGLSLTSEKLSDLCNQSEGWIAAIHLAVLAIRRKQQIPDKIISGDQRFISDYLYEDVLAHLDEDTQQFLMRTSILAELCPSLCNAVLGMDNARSILDKIERENLLLIPLDSRRTWFRYHNLFRECLLEYLNQEYPDDIPGYRRRAAKWYFEHDMPEQAFQYALAAADSNIVNQIFERYFPAKLQGGELQVLGRWLDAIPGEWVIDNPMIGLAQAGLMLFSGQFEAAILRLGEIEKLARANEDMQWHAARVTAIRCFIACQQNDLSQAEQLADQALQKLPQDDFDFRHDIYLALGDTYRKSGRWQEAKASYLKALEFKQAPIFRLQSVHIYGALADLSLRQGQLRTSHNYWEQALGVIRKPENRGAYPLPVIGWVYIRIGELLYEWNELAEAWHYVSQGIERAELGGDVRSMIAGYLIAGSIKLAEGDSAAAAHYLEEARPLVQSAKFTHWTSQFERFQLELWLAQDRLRAAVDWSDKMLEEAKLEERPESEISQLAMARVLIVKGDRPSIDRGMTLLEGLLITAEKEGRTGIMIEGLALQSIAYWQQGRQAEALVHLERALRLAETEGYIRLFVDMGLPMARLLQEARSRDVMLDYVNELLGAFETDFELSPKQTLPEPLTPREHDVLQLMAAGLTNPEIAEELVIAAGTVKKHAANIYGKLGVSNRTEAAARARELDLLEKG